MALTESFNIYKADYQIATGKSFDNDIDQYLSYLKIRVMEKQILSIGELAEKIHNLEDSINSLKNRVDDLADNIRKGNR